MPNPEDAPDCEFHGESATGTLSELATDLGGWAVDMTVNGGVLEQTSAARFDNAESSAIDFRVNMDSGDSGYLWSYSTNHQLEVNTGVVNIYVNGSLVGAHTITDISGTAEDFLISWAWEFNPLTTGASDEMRSEITVRNETNGTWEHSAVVHEAVPDGTSTAYIGGTAPSTNVFSGLILAARISARFHSTTELYETWVSESSPPTLSGDSRLESPTPAFNAGLGNDGMFCGPVELMAAAAVRKNDRMMVAPLVNEICTGSWAEDSTWTMTDPDNAGVEMHAEFMRRRPVPPGVNRVRVRAQVQQNAASAQTLGIRAYCGNLPGPIAGAGTDDYETFSAATTRNADDGVGATGGAWVTVAESIRIPESNTRYRYFWLGFVPGSVTDYRVRAWTVEPFEDQDPDGIGSGGGFAG